MLKYGAKLVFQGRDEFGAVEVVENEYERSLHFGTAAKQSSMSLAEPLRLHLTYTEAMVAPLMFRPEPRRVLLVGLGGGSLAKFLLQHFPRCLIDAVELRELVAHVAQTHFHLPDTPRLRVSVDDAAGFVADRPVEEYGDYDLILVDAFMSGGIANTVACLSFFEGCSPRLAKDGMAAVNLWARDRIGLKEMLTTIGDGLSRRVWRLPVRDKDNVIALAGHPTSRRSSRDVSERARLLSAKFGVGFVGLLKMLRKHNSDLP